MDGASLLPKLFHLQHCRTAAMFFHWSAERIVVTYDFWLNNIWIMIYTVILYIFAYLFLYHAVFYPRNCCLDLRGWCIQTCMFIHAALTTSTYTAFIHQRQPYFHLQTCTFANSRDAGMRFWPIFFSTRDEEWEAFGIPYCKIFCNKKTSEVWQRKFLKVLDLRASFQPLLFKN